jgi:hypothetical protein
MGYLRTTLTSGGGGGVIPGHNGGRSQTNFGFIYTSDWPFLNVLKNAPMPEHNDVNSSHVPVTPDLLNADGYPLATGTHGGFHWTVDIQPTDERPGNYILTWDGTGSITGTGAGGSPLGTATFTGSITGTTLTISGLSGTIQPGQRVTGGTVLPYTFIMSGSGTTYTVSKSQSATGITGADGGSFSSSGGAGAGFMAMTILAGISQIQFKIATVGSPIITNVQIYHVGDAAQVAAGEIWGTEFLRRIREANFGVLRFLNWQDGNTANSTTWRTRKPISYATYQGDQLNNNYYAGVTTNSGNAYSAAFPPFHSSDGTAWTSGGPKDRDTIHVRYNAAATQSGTCSLNVGGTGAVNILTKHGGALVNVFYPGSAGDFPNNSVATLTYDAKMVGWVQQGGNADQGSVGFHDVVPPELMVQLCKDVGAHPYFVSPVYSLDPATDYMAELAYYCKTYAAANAPWMIPRFEVTNELWNNTFQTTNYANVRAQAVWPGVSGVGFMDWYGKALANLGQICAGVYGGANLGVTYQVLCGVQTTNVPAASDERLNSTAYIGQAAAADPSLTGAWGTITFTKQAAKLTTSHVCNSQYISPTQRFTIGELTQAYSYSVTNRGNTAAQGAIADAYCDGLLGESALYNLQYNKDAWAAWKAWGAAKGVNGMCGYEGCWSPDHMNVNPGAPERASWWSFPTGRTQVNPAIIQLSTHCTNNENDPFNNMASNGNIAGTPAVVGMGVMFATGSTFDNPSFRSVTIAGSGPSANIVGTNTLRVNQSVYFRADILPSELTAELVLTQFNPNQPHSILYYVTSASPTQFQVSATRGGTPITFNSTGTSVFALECWRITAVDNANNRVTLDLDSTGFTVPTSGRMYYVHSQIYSNNIRCAGKRSTHMQGYLYGGAISSYQNYLDVGGEFPSNFLMSGPGPISGNVWNVLEPITQSPNPPQWLAIMAFNH